MKFIHGLLFFINIIAVIALLICYFAPYIHPNTGQFLPIFGLAYPYLFILNVIFFLAWLFSKWTYSLLSLIALLIGAGAIQRMIAFRGSKMIKSKQTIELASYNIADGRYKPENNTSMFKYLKQELNYDILCLQECRTTIKSKLKQQFNKHYIASFDKKTPIVISKHKILKKGFLDFKDNYNSAVWADIQFRDQTIRVYSVHLQSNKVSRIANSVRNSEEMNHKERWGKLRHMFSNYNSSTKKRILQVKTLLKHIDSCPHPVLVAGDFNDVPQSYMYSQLREKLNDAFVRRGIGLGTSYNGSIPALRIDYIFSSDHFNPLSFQTNQVMYSDHFPVTSSLILR